MSKKEELLEALSSIDEYSWELIITKRPFTKTMKKIVEKWETGKFAVLSLILGLNNYQTKGKAEKGYWKPVRGIIEALNGKTITLQELQQALHGFYSEERFAENKLIRLDRFMGSNLASKLWEIDDSEYFVHNFQSLHLETAKVMMQDESKKTIVFAMKCLGMALFMKGRRDFDFNGVDIPVDSRVEAFYHHIGLDLDSHQQIQSFSLELLAGLQKKQVTMMHLDSLIWDISNLQSEDRKRYYEIRQFKYKTKQKFESLLASWRPKEEDSGC